MGRRREFKSLNPCVFGLKASHTKTPQNVCDFNCFQRGRAAHGLSLKAMIANAFVAEKLVLKPGCSTPAMSIAEQNVS
jgi:hypothetical protein